MGRGLYRASEYGAKRELDMLNRVSGLSLNGFRYTDFHRPIGEFQRS